MAAMGHLWMMGIMFYLLKMVLLHSNVKITRLLPHQATKSLDTAHLAFQNENFQTQPLKLSPREHTTIPKWLANGYPHDCLLSSKKTVRSNEYKPKKKQPSTKVI